LFAFGGNSSCNRVYVFFQSSTGAAEPLEHSVRSSSREVTLRAFVNICTGKDLDWLGKSHPESLVNLASTTEFPAKRTPTKPILGRKGIGDQVKDGNQTAKNRGVHHCFNHKWGCNSLQAATAALQCLCHSKEECV